jgi:hypothetical protein
VSRALIYVSHPVVSYDSDHERTALADLGRLLPNARIINPATRYLSTSSWESDWPTLVAQLSALIVFGAEDNSVGAGCLREIADAIVHVVPIRVLRRGDLYELASLRFRPAQRRSPARLATVVAGKPKPLQLRSRPLRLVGAPER